MFQTYSIVWLDFFSFCCETHWNQNSFEMELTDRLLLVCWATLAETKEGSVSNLRGKLMSKDSEKKFKNKQTNKKTWDLGSMGRTQKVLHFVPCISA